MIRRKIKGNPIAVAILLALSLLENSAFTADRQFTIRDGGGPRVFELSKGERFEASDPGKPRRASSPPPGAGDSFPVLYEAGKPKTEYSRRIVTGQVVVQLLEGKDPKIVAADTGGRWVRSFEFAQDHHLLAAPLPDQVFDFAERLRRHPAVSGADIELGRLRTPRHAPNDPLFGLQWNLSNSGQQGGTVGADINVVGAWDYFTGAGVLIGIVDDGLDLGHPDLAAGIDAGTGLDLVSGDSDPSPTGVDDFHGTAVAGILGARGDNSEGIIGVAFESDLVGIRLLHEVQTDAQEALALSYRRNDIQIYNNSWGPPDFGSDLIGPDPLMAAALRDGTMNGRGGRGSIFTWSGGNGYFNHDNSNYDGYANSIYTIAVAAVNDLGASVSYSEAGANLIVSAPGGGGNDRPQEITTTDLRGANGYNSNAQDGENANLDYTGKFQGTSAAAPHVAGAVALMLEANPLLGWRDVQEVLMRSARQSDTENGPWDTNGAGFQFNHFHGAGMLDVSNAVMMAYGWTNLGPHTSKSFSFDSLSLDIPDNNLNGVTKFFDIPALPFRVEHITIAPEITHTFRGDLVLLLKSPSGMISVLASRSYDAHANISGWNYMSVRHWGEDPEGTWELGLVDAGQDDVGRLTGLNITFYGGLSEANPVVSTNLPLVLAAPSGQSVEAGDAVTFSVQVLNPENATFQWFHEGSAISAAANPSLMLTDVSASDNGSYHVEVSNPFGTVATDAIPLEVRSPPVILVNPTGTRIVGGADHEFMSQAVGSGPLAYQWRLNEVFIEQGTNATLSLTNVNRHDSGTYSVLVTNAFGMVISSNADLLVRVPQRLELLGSSPGGPFRFQFGNADGLALRSSDIGGFKVEYSTNLMRMDWIELPQSTTLSNGFIQFEDAAPDGPRRFYRVTED